MRKSNFILCVGLMMCLGCVGVRVGFLARDTSPVKVSSDENIALVKFQQLEKDKDFDSGKELTDLTRRVLEEGKYFKAIELLSYNAGEGDQPNTPAEWFKTPETINWQALESTAKCRLAIFGATIFHGHDQLEYVTETVEDPYSGRPIRRTVEKQMATYSYEIKIALVDISQQKIALKKEYKGSKSFEGKVNIYDLYTLLEPDVREFISLISGEQHREQRRLLR